MTQYHVVTTDNSQFPCDVVNSTTGKAVTSAPDFNTASVLAQRLCDDRTNDGSDPYEVDEIDEMIFQLEAQGILDAASEPDVNVYTIMYETAPESRGFVFHDGTEESAIDVAMRHTTTPGSVARVFIDVDGNDVLVVSVKNLNGDQRVTRHDD